jgi:hypothetical protein
MMIDRERNAKLKTALRVLSAAVLLVVGAGCGQVESVNDRTLGADDINIHPQRAHSGDATADTTQDQGGGTDPGEAPAEEGGDDAANPAGPDLARLVTSAGLRNYEQINATMATVTGVPATTAAVRDVFVNQLATSLPTDNDIKSFLGSQQVAVFKLAVSYCEALVANTTARAAVFGTFNFAGTPAASLNAAGKQAVADALVAKFWGKDLENLPAHADSTAQVVKLMDDLLVGKSQTTATVTPVVVEGACTAVLSAAPVTML